MALVIEMSVEDIADWLYDMAEMKDSVTYEAKQWIAWFIEDTMKEEVPVGLSRRLHDSITAIISDDGVMVFPDIWYAIHVEDGTRASPGTYISTVKPKRRDQFPYVGGRVGWGIHRGTPANPFVQRTFERLENEMDEFLETYLDNIIYPKGRKTYG